MYEFEYDDASAIPSEVKHLYVEKNGKWVLMAAGEVKSQEDVNNVLEGLRKEREDHAETKGKLRKFNGMDPEELHTKLDRLDELEAAGAGNKIDDDKIEEMVERRVRAKTGPLNREIERLTSSNSELEETVNQFKSKDTQRIVHDHIRKAASAAKVRDTAIEDAITVGERLFEVDESGKVVAKDGVGITPGVDPSVWLTEVRQNRPHWWPESQGAGAGGGDGGNSFASNPFSKDGWNLTQQGALIKENRARAEQMAKAAGTTIGGPRPK